LTFLALVGAATGTISAADRTSFGVGIGALYNGIGGGFALIKADDLKYLSVGCSEFSRSSIVHSEAEPSIRMPYVFFFKGLDRKGWNLGVAPLVRWDAEDTEIGVMFEVGYQF
jgi:hypothetical protein